MNLLAGPFLKLIWRTRILRRGAMVCVVLALVASAAEIAVAVSLVPILASLGVDAGGMAPAVRAGSHSPLNNELAVISAG